MLSILIHTFLYLFTNQSIFLCLCSTFIFRPSAYQWEVKDWAWLVGVATLPELPGCPSPNLSTFLSLCRTLMVSANCISTVRVWAWCGWLASRRGSITQVTWLSIPLPSHVFVSVVLLIVWPICISTRGLGLCVAWWLPSLPSPGRPSPSSRVCPVEFVRCVCLALLFSSSPVRC